MNYKVLGMTLYQTYGGGKYSRNISQTTSTKSFVKNPRKYCARALPVQPTRFFSLLPCKRSGKLDTGPREGKCHMNIIRVQALF